LTPELVVLYDADCGLCAWLLVQLLRPERHGRLRPEPIQSPEGQRLLARVAPELRLQSWHVVDAHGAVTSAGAALPRVLRCLPGGRPLAALAAAFPGSTEVAYRWVADHREVLARALPESARRRARDRLLRAGATAASAPNAPNAPGPPNAPSPPDAPDAPGT
jgi:predicted DCC family thiol-disulfide oxidoreductase YuxK